MDLKQVEIPVREKRRFLPDGLIIDSWNAIEPYFLDLEKREFNSIEDLQEWLLDRSELEAVLEEDLAWRYIKMNIDTTDKELAKAFQFFVTEVQPKIAPFDNKFDKKFVDSPYLKELDQDKYYIYLRAVKKQMEIFRDENIPLFTEMQTEQQKFGNISGAQTIAYGGEEMTMQQASKLLKDTDRAKREEVFLLMKARKLKDVDALDELYSALVKLRHQIAVNAGFENYRDYKFAELGRFDYSVQDCFDFHQAIGSELVPLNNQLNEKRKQDLGVEKLKPWDMAVDPTGKAPLKPVEDNEELINKTIECFKTIRPYFGECLAIMKEMGHLDLGSKVGKAPGGFNYPLYEIGVPFIYMNSVGTFRDMITIIHEGGHAIHSFLSRDLEITAFKNLPSEVAELASMGMELLSMDYWQFFFDSEEDLKRAKKEHLETILEILPWVATIDKFQHWVYENPNHGAEERGNKWVEILGEFGSSVIDWSGHEDSKATSWQKQMHLFEVPFYYIEYAIAQLGAIALWKSFKENPEQTLDNYQKALSLGYTVTIGEIYEAAGIRFDFSKEYVHEIVEFVKGELAQVS